jgi:hypothetical protein
MERKITEDEIKLTEWLIEHAQNKVNLKGITIDKNSIVVSGCKCGCPSFDFKNDSRAGLDVVSDWFYRDEENHLNGIFLYLKNGSLGGVEIWSVDGQSEITEFPDVSKLVEVDSGQDAGKGTTPNNVQALRRSAPPGLRPHFLPSLRFGKKRRLH